MAYHLEMLVDLKSKDITVTVNFAFCCDNDSCIVINNSLKQCQTVK